MAQATTSILPRAASPCWTQVVDTSKAEVTSLGVASNTWATRWGWEPGSLFLLWCRCTESRVSMSGCPESPYHLRWVRVLFPLDSIPHEWNVPVNSCWINVCWGKKGLGLPTLPSCWCQLPLKLFVCLFSFMGILCLSADSHKEVHESSIIFLLDISKHGFFFPLLLDCYFLSEYGILHDNRFSFRILKESLHGLIALSALRLSPQMSFWILIFCE